jgi:hypothetical protein
MPNLTGNPNQPVNVTIRALEPTDNAIPDLWNVPFQQLLNNDANLNQRVSSLETSQGGTTLAAHRSASVLDHPDGSVTTTKLANGAVTLQKLASTAVSTDPTPNTLALRNAQGGVQDGAAYSFLKVLRAGGLYSWFTSNKWLRLVRWTGISGTNSYRVIFADLYLHRVLDYGIGSRLRARVSTEPSGTFAFPAISVANDGFAVVTNALLLQIDEDTIELWAYFPYGNIYVSGVVGSGLSSGIIELTPYGDVSAIVEDTAPTPVSGGLYLEWATATAGQTLLGPGYIVAASRNTSSGYIRYDNGIQVCWATITVGSGTWTYPAAFASTPQVQATAQDTAPRLATITSVSTTAAGVLRTDLSGTTQSGTVQLWAIGLWK